MKLLTGIRRPYHVNTTRHAAGKIRSSTRLLHIRRISPSTLVLYAGKLGDSFIRDYSSLLLVPQKKNERLPEWMTFPSFERSDGKHSHTHTHKRNSATETRDSHRRTRQNRGYFARAPKSLRAHQQPAPPPPSLFPKRGNKKNSHCTHACTGCRFVFPPRLRECLIHQPIFV